MGAQSQSTDSDFRDDIEALLEPTIPWNFEDAMQLVLDQVVAKLPGDPWRGAGDGLRSTAEGPTAESHVERHFVQLRTTVHGPAVPGLGAPGPLIPRDGTRTLHLNPVVAPPRRPARPGFARQGRVAWLLEPALDQVLHGRHGFGSV